MSNKTEAPTAKRLRRARRDGETAKSAHLTTAFSGLAWWLYLSIEAPRLYALFASLIERITSLDARLPFRERLAHTLAMLDVLVLPSLVALGVGALAVLVPESMQTRGMLAWKRVAPDPKHLNPVNGLRQLVSIRVLWDGALTLLQFAILLALFVQALLTALRQLAPVYAWPVPAHLGYIAITHSHLFAWMAASQIVPGAADYFIQRFLWMRDMRMDKSEIKREFRDDEGDPQIKSRRRAIHRELGQ
ncbi:EscU/YscU/HrcU family type III secretion system export apparatus switch protein [Paraburkholderia sp.]|uniref:EscU/YscU/HrcU family type III secretion system export apparatus switch protein n=1 Tax=Paraburkholderia sp. TaxID=1926495 RepID=UPI0023956615|nr:EscU/YscU/HrcU family type III secretion system export apparatus switch protein [Paraburkholderia sp.]MDE1184515.1 EscU/YscU/HrcU family type III secretion system export apparatus switch protein [Paraburkholderia sp.]